MACPGALGLLLLVAAGPRPQADAPPPAADEVPLSVRGNHAIARGVQRLREVQGEDGRWTGDETRYPGGLTAFGAYTLLKAGVRRDDADLASALSALATIPPRSTYGSSVRLLLYEALAARDGSPAAWAAAAEPSLAVLLDGQRMGLWGYPEDPIDLSNVQFALLGLHAAERLGLEVPADTWEDCAKALWRYQKDDGSFSYRPDLPGTGGITAATLGGLELLARASEEHGGVRTALRRRRAEAAAAAEWLAERWHPARNAWGPRAWTPGWNGAYLWAVQRYAELAGLDALGGRDWYAEGARHLVETQHADGGWGKTEETCYALLFLRRTTFSGGEELALLYERLDALDADAAAAPTPTLDPAVPRLADWLVAGPFAGELGATGLLEPPFDVARAGRRARAGGRVGGERWERVALRTDGATDLEAELGRGRDHALWTLATTLRVEGDEPVDALLWLAAQDGWRVLLDGAELARDVRVRAPVVLDVRVPLALAPGEHDLLLLLEDAIGGAYVEVRLSAPDGAPLGDAVAHGVGR